MSKVLLSIVLGDAEARWKRAESVGPTAAARAPPALCAQPSAGVLALVGYNDDALAMSLQLCAKFLLGATCAIYPTPLA